MKKTILLIDFLPISGTCTGLLTQIRIMAETYADLYRFVVIGSKGSILEKNEEKLPYIFYGVDSAVALSELYYHPWNTIQRYIRTCVFIFRICRKEHVDLLHCYHYMWSPYVSPIGLLLGKPVLIHLKDVWLLQPKIARIMMKCNPFARYIAVSNYVYTLFIETYNIPQPSTVMVYDGIDSAIFSYPGYAFIESKFSSRNKTIVMISRVAPERDIEVFIDMAYLVSRTFPHIRFYHYGFMKNHVQHEYVKTIRKRILDLKLGNVVKLKPYISDPKAVSKMLQDATISIVPARRFALPNVAIESQLCGTPVVALNTGGNHEIITPRNGLLLSSLSPILFARAVETLLSNKHKYMQFAQQGSLRAKRMFDASMQCKKISDLYMSTLYG